MIERNEEAQDSDESMWADAITLSPVETRDAKIHVSLRLDPAIYRAIVKEKKAVKDRTITATIERLLHRGLKAENPAELAPSINAEAFQSAIRSLAAHSVLQDKMLKLIVSNVKLPAKDKQVFASFEKLYRISEGMQFPDVASSLKPRSKPISRKSYRAK